MENLRDFQNACFMEDFVKSETYGYQVPVKHILLNARLQVHSMFQILHPSTDT